MTVVLGALALAVVLLAWRVWRLEIVLLNVHDTVTAEPAPEPEPVSVTDDTAVFDVGALRQVTLGELFRDHAADDLTEAIRVDPRIQGPAS